MNFESIAGIAEQVPQLKRGIVWCLACSRRQRVEIADAFRYGWPQCCGATMTLDSPEEREALVRRNG